MDEYEVIRVSRTITRIVGWSLVFIGVISAFLFFLDNSLQLIVEALFLTPLGVQQILSARNVKEIAVGRNSIKFLPVGAELLFSEIDRMVVPSWADPFDTPPSALATLTFETNIDKARYVPEAILQWNRGCRINFHGCDGNKMLKALRRHVSE